MSVKLKFFRIVEMDEAVEAWLCIDHDSFSGELEVAVLKKRRWMVVTPLTGAGPSYKAADVLSPLSADSASGE